LETVNIGVDLGSTGLRAVCYGPTGQLLSIERDAGSDAPWLLYERPADTPLGVDFPGLKSLLGANVAFTVEGRPSSPGQLVEDALRDIRLQVEGRTACHIRQTVVSVPARYSTVQRTALREAALAAGLTALRLISDTVSAVVAHTEHREAWSTVLVCSLGYSGLELALVRAKRGHARVLAYEGDSVSGGRALDGVVMELWFDLFRRRGLTFPTHTWDMAMWHGLRDDAQAVKQRLSEAERTAFTIPVTRGSRRQRRLVIRRATFERALAPMIAATTDGVRALLEQTNSAMQEIDEVLLVGGSTLIPCVQLAIAKQTEREPILVAAGELARAAAVYAATLEVESAGGLEEPSDPAGQHDNGTMRGELRAEPGARSAGAAPAIAATAVDGVTAADRLPTRADLDEVAQKLASARQGAEAVARLQELERDVRAVLDGLEADEQQRTVPTAAARALARAERLLTRGKYEEAVRNSHHAWQHAPNDPDVFDAMIDIHCKAAVGDGAEQRHADAILWLTCAHGHDRSNQRVRDLLADRRFAQASEFAREHRHDEALRAIDDCLTWRPDNPDARELQQALRDLL